MKTASALVLGLGLGLASAANGGITYLEQTREHTLNGSAISDAATDYDPFVSTITDLGPGRAGESMHISTLSSSGLAAVGSVSYTGGAAPGTFANRLDVLFSVDAPSDWTLSGLIDSAGEVNGEENFVEIIFRNETTPSVVFYVGTFDGALNVDRTVSLAPATEYRLIISLGGEYFGPSDVASSFDLTFVPSPSAAVLLGLGGLVAVRRRR